MLKFKSSTSVGIAQVLSGAALISLVGIFIKIMVVDYAQPIFVVTFWRNLFVCVSLLAGLRIFKPQLLKFERENIGLLALYAANLTAMNGVWGGSVYFNGAGVSTVLVYLSVPITVLAQWAFGGEKPSLRILPSIMFCLTGCALVCGIQGMSDFSLTPMGMFLGLLSSVFFSSYALLGRECTRRGMSSYSIMMHIFGIAAVYMFFLNMLSQGMIPGTAYTPGGLLMPGVDWKGWACILTLALGPSMTGWTLITASFNHLSPSVVNLLLTVEPMITALVAIPVLGEYMNMEQWAGCFLIVIGVIVLKKR